MKLMSTAEETRRRLAEIPNLTVSIGTPLSRYTRFAIGGPADVFAETCSSDAFMAAISAARQTGIDVMVIGGGTNLIVSDAGYRGLVIRFRDDRISADETRVRVGAGAILQELVDFANRHGLRGLETLAGIPGWVGAAVYGNAGAYGHAINERVFSVQFFDGKTVQTFDNHQCEFQYRESIFKRHKTWIIFSVELAMDPSDSAELERISAEILAVRNAKFPPTMKCAGSIFKNFLMKNLPPAVAAQVPPAVVREGKIPAAWFLEQVGAKGLRRGGIQVADYHANLIYNAGDGTAAELSSVIAELKSRVRVQFNVDVEEEVQYVG
jgi:UDP-N-acetylmuramate dehydrogenase